MFTLFLYDKFKRLTKKKILIFIDWFLPGYKAGGPVRSMANMVEHLAGMYDFYIVTRNTDYQETEPYADIDHNKWVEYQKGVKIFYASSEFQGKKTFKRLIQEEAFDIVYVNGIYSWKYSILPLLVLKKSGIKKIIVASRGMLTQSAINIKSDKKRLFLIIARILGLYNGITFHVTNDKEGYDVKKAVGKNADVIVASNLPRKNKEQYRQIKKQPGELRFVNLARIAPEKNILYALERLVDIGNISGNITFDIYGQIYDKEYWKKCERVILKLPENIKVNYKGTVETDGVANTISNYHFLFMPTLGENFGHVILESLFVGRSTLISDQTPWRNMEDKRAGWDLPLEDTKVWGEKIRELLNMEDAEYQEWSRGAQSVAKEYVNSQRIIDAYIAMF